MSVANRYRANYDQIAADHVKYWRETGRNPFQEESILRHNEASTEHYIREYAPEKGIWLDAACGMGDLLMKFPGRPRCGIDISAEYVAVAEERGLKVDQCSIEQNFYASNTFSLVTATDVLEHVLDLNKAVRALLRVLQPGGILIVRTPFEEALSTSSDPYEYVHLRRFDYATLYLLFKKIFDCEIISIPQDMEIIHAVVRK